MTRICNSYQQVFGLVQQGYVLGMLASFSISHNCYDGNALGVSGTINFKLHPLHCIAGSDFILMVSTVLLFARLSR